MDWWHWIAAALSLGILEVLAPGHIFLGFAAGAGLVGLLLLNGPGRVWLSASWPLAILVWALLSLLIWIGLRLGFSRRSRPKIWKRDIND